MRLKDFEDGNCFKGEPMTKENVTKAYQTSDLLLSDLREALKTASAVEGLLLLDAIETAAKLRLRLEAIDKAITG